MTGSHNTRYTAPDGTVFRSRQAALAELGRQGARCANSHCIGRAVQRVTCRRALEVVLASMSGVHPLPSSRCPPPAAPDTVIGDRLKEEAAAAPTPEQQQQRRRALEDRVRARMGT